MGEEMTPTTVPYDKQNADTGRFEATYPPEEFVDALRTADAGLTTQEVRERIGCAYRTAHARLTDLEDDGRVTSRDVGRAKLWSPPNAGEQAAETPPHTEATDDAESTPDPGERPESISEDEGVTAALDALDLPGSGAKLDERRDAVRAAVEYLRENGTATPADFQADVYPGHRARYTDGEDPAYSWWNNAVSKGLNQVAEQTSMVDPADTSGVWAWSGDDDGSNPGESA